MNGSEFSLVGDVGATNARFACVQPDGTITRTHVFGTDDYATIAAAIETYLAHDAPGTNLEKAVLAVACPVTGDEVSLTNHPWSFSVKQLREQLGIRPLRVINDFVAVALAVPKLAATDLVQVGSGSGAADAPIGVIGPGTGLGVSALIRAGDEWIPLSTEGGHVTMAASNARESEVLDLMRRRYDYVSAERVLSGRGLVNLYSALCELAGKPAAPFTPAQITNPQIGQEDPRASEATQMFCAMLGTVARNLTLSLGARGGIYIGGGIVPRLGRTFPQSEFRASFEGTGRFREYLAQIPTYVIMRPFPALLGAASLLPRL